MSTLAGENQDRLSMCQRIEPTFAVVSDPGGPGRDLSPRRQPFQGCDLWGKLKALFMLSPSYCRRKAITFLNLLRLSPIPRRQSVPELCLQVQLGNFRIGGTERKVHAKR